MKTTVATILFILADYAYANRTICIESLENNRRIVARIELPMKGRHGKVTYQRGSGHIPLLLAKTKKEMGDGQRPLEFTELWLEKPKNRSSPTGEYHITSQGTNINLVEYTNYKMKYSITFETNIGDSIAEKCW